jgi:hypothetical protein
MTEYVIGFVPRGPPPPADLRSEILQSGLRLDLVVQADRPLGLGGHKAVLLGPGQRLGAAQVEDGLTALGVLLGWPGWFGWLVWLVGVS